MKTSPLALLLLPLLLTQCVDPFMMDPNGGGSYGGANSNPYRQNMQGQGSQLSSLAYERGQQDGQADAQQRQSQNYNRHRTRFERNTEMPYRDGYNQAFSQSSSSLNSGYQNGYGSQEGAVQPQQPANDPVYNQGYDYGLRDRTGGRVADPAGYAGRYDPRYRSSFERGYYDSYNSRSTQSTPPNSGSSFFYR